MQVHEQVTKAMRQNGCKLVTVMHFPGRGCMAPFALVIAKRSNRYHPFVVWAINTQCGGAYSGGYHETVQAAWEDYKVRVDRELSYSTVNAA